MIRRVLYFLVVGLLAATAAWMADHPGDVLIHWLGYEAQTSVGALIIGALLLGIIFYGLVRAMRLVARGPAAFARARRQRRHVRRLHSLARGFSAAAIGDGSGARKALNAIDGGDNLAGLKGLLAAQVAEIERDEPAVEAAYRDLLKHQDTEFLGLRGLYESAIRQGDREAALAFATRAFEARPRSPWLAEQLFRVQTQSGAWELARKTIATERKSGGLTDAAARRREGVLTAAEALAAEAAGDADKAFGLARKALDRAPSLVPMAVIVAKAQAAKAQTWAAAGTIEAAWRVHPHPDLARVYATLKASETEQQHARRMMGLAEFNPNHIESRLLVASEALKVGETRRARRALRPALDAPSARVLMLMSEVALRAGGGEAEAAAFRSRAVAAPRDAQWVCSACARERDSWTPVCDGCGGFDSYAWGMQGGLAGAGLATAMVQGGIDWQEDLTDAAPLPTPEPPAGAKPTPISGVIERPAAAPPPMEQAGGVEIFTPPRQPDDPGTEEPAAVTAALRSY